MMADTFHFLRPEWLWVSPAPIILLILFWRRQGGSGYWKSHCDPHLLPHLLHGENSRPRRLPLLLLGVGWSLALLALAGPVWERLPQPLFRPQYPVVIVLDLSQSMLTTDVRPSRLARAKQKVLDLLKRTSGGQTGLVVFAGDAFIVSPLTDDVETVAALVPSLTPAIMPAQGSRPDRGLRQAADLLQRAALGDGTVILITDGDAAPTESFQAAQTLAATGHRLSVLGVGTPQGGLVPRADGRGFLSDAAGQRVLARLNRERLAALTNFGPGVYADLTAGDGDLKRLLGRSVQEENPDSARALERLADDWREMGPWLLPLLVPLAALAFRRGWLLLVMIFPLLSPSPARAFDWADLWQRPDQRGAAALERGEAARAAELFESPGWRGTARYQAGDFAGAAEAFSRTPGAKGSFNRGNALARQGKLEEAMTAYAEALKKNPADEDARFNHDLVKKVLEQQQQQQQQQNQQGDGQERKDPGNQDEQSGQSGDQGEKQGESGQERDASEKDAGNTGMDEKEPTAAERAEEEAREEQRAAQREAEKKAADESMGKAEETPEEKTAEQEAAEEGEEEKNHASASERQEDDENRESDQALSQWLRRIPDDPGGLLRRKFYRQYRRRGQGQTEMNRGEMAPW